MTAPIVAQSNFIVDVKTAIMRALYAAFQDIDYPEKEIRNIKISLEYPMEENLYPHMWVQFSLTSLKQEGIGHEIYDEVNHLLKQVFIFEGRVSISILSLSTLARDVLASQLVQMLAFRKNNPIASQFDEYLRDDTTVRMAINRDELGVEGQSAAPGTPWDTNQIIYTDGYSFNLIGEVESKFTVTPEILRNIVVNATEDITGEVLQQVYGDPNYVPATVDLGEWQ